MRYQGKITNWKGDKGFGFITPKEGGNSVFVHIKAFSNRKRHPLLNDVVTYELVSDQKGRARAEKALFVDYSSTVVFSNIRIPVSLFLSIIFVIFVAALTFAGKLPYVVLCLYLGASIAAFVAYALDKSAAQNDRWRTQESTLHLLGLIGGWPGALIAQRLLRHKTKKQSFQVAFWTTVILNCGSLIWLLTPQGINILRSILSAVALTK